MVLALLGTLVLFGAIAFGTYPDESFIVIVGQAFGGLFLLTAMFVVIVIIDVSKEKLRKLGNQILILAIPISLWLMFLNYLPVELFWISLAILAITLLIAMLMPVRKS